MPLRKMIYIVVVIFSVYLLMLLFGSACILLSAYASGLYTVDYLLRRDYATSNICY